MYQARYRLEDVSAEKLLGWTRRFVDRYGAQKRLAITGDVMAERVVVTTDEEPAAMLAKVKEAGMDLVGVKPPIMKGEGRFANLDLEHREATASSRDVEFLEGLEELYLSEVGTPPDVTYWEDVEFDPVPWDPYTFLAFLIAWLEEPLTEGRKMPVGFHILATEVPETVELAGLTPDTEPAWCDACDLVHRGDLCQRVRDRARLESISTYTIQWEEGFGIEAQRLLGMARILSPTPADLDAELARFHRALEAFGSGGPA